MAVRTSSPEASRATRSSLLPWRGSRVPVQAVGSSRERPPPCSSEAIERQLEELYGTRAQPSQMQDDPIARPGLGHHDEPGLNGLALFGSVAFRRDAEPDGRTLRRTFLRGEGHPPATDLEEAAADRLLGRPPKPGQGRHRPGGRVAFPESALSLRKDRIHQVLPLNQACTIGFPAPATNVVR